MSCDGEKYPYRAQLTFDSDPEVPDVPSGAIGTTADLQWDSEQGRWMVTGPGVD